MFRHNLKLIFRNIKRSKSSFFINMIGLSTGLACALLIYLWVNDELRFDKFHENDSRLYQVMQNLNEPSGISTVDGTPGLLAQAMKEEIPEIEYAAAAVPAQDNNNGLIAFGDKRIRVTGQFVSKDYFNIFSWKFVEGDKNNVLPDKQSLALSDELAMKLFNTTDVVGKPVEIEWKRTPLSGTYHITAVFKKIPANSSEAFDLLFNYEIFFEKYDRLKNWGNSIPRTFVTVKGNTNVDQLNQKIAGFLKPKDPESNSALFLRKYSDQYLYGVYENGVPVGGRIEYVRLFSIISLFILCIACINFMNLSTAKASGRMKEVGVKKTIGAGRRTLILQYMGESMLMAFLSLLVAIGLVLVLLPQFNNITGKQLSFPLDTTVILTVLGITFFTGFVSGSYPALYISGFKPAVVLRGRIMTSIAELWARKGLVVFQFVISVVLIVSVLVVYRQIDYVQSKNLGYNKDNIIYFGKEGRLNTGLESFLAEVKKIPGVINATSMRGEITGGHGTSSGFSWEGQAPGGKDIQFGVIPVGYDFIETLGIQLTEGRSFSRNFTSEDKTIVLNEAAIEAMGLKNPVGKIVDFYGPKEIIGVVKNFHFESLHEKVKPFFFQFYPDGENVLVKIKGGTERDALDRIQKFFYQFNQGLAFEYKFLDENYQRLYASEKRVANLSRYFAGIAIIISCLGLFGLAAFTAERRMKEICIRKVLGSGEMSIVVMLTNGFTKMVIAAIIIAWPLSFWLTKNWLDNFAYRIDLSFWYFIIAGIIALVTAWFTVATQAIKAARVSPAANLKEN